MGEAELVTPPDYATVEIGVITQGTSVGATLAENSARMSKVIDAVRGLGIADSDIQTSTFNIAPRYQKSDGNDYDPYAMRPIVGYSVANKALITVTDLGKIAKIVDASIDAGGNASGSVQFRMRNLTEKMDKARQAAIENAHHKAAILAAAAGLKLGRALSVTDNQSSTNFDSRAGGNQVETVVITGSRAPAPIMSGEIALMSEVTVVYATD